MDRTRACGARSAGSTPAGETVKQHGIFSGARRNVCMAEHCSFCIGGDADILVRPTDKKELQEVVCACHTHSIPIFVLGDGTNILVADRGVRGVVIDMKGFDDVSLNGNMLTVGAGCDMAEVSMYATEHGLSGLEFIYGMPGTVGGAVFMNARCFGGEVVEVLESVSGVCIESGEVFEYVVDAKDFAYKVSPFQDNTRIITSVTFLLQPGDVSASLDIMKKNKGLREEKGHYLYPCAGSMFKNNKVFGAPSGEIIDGVGLRGYAVGDAQVAPFHGNICINKGKARAEDMQCLVSHVRDVVERKTGFVRWNQRLSLLVSGNI